MRLMAGLDRQPKRKSSFELVLGRDRVAVRETQHSMVYQNRFIQLPQLHRITKISLSPLRLAKMDEKKLDRRYEKPLKLLSYRNPFLSLPLQLSGGTGNNVTAMAEALVKDSSNYLCSMNHCV